MSHVDDAIRRALSPEDLRALDDLDREPPILLQAFRAFETQQRWVGVVSWLIGFLLFGACGYCTLRFFQAPDLRTMILWGAGGGLAALGLVMIKLWFFMEMQKNSIVREVKRLELQIASLRTRL
ncbi:MAG: hypothetical protein Q7T61_09770 [Caulobacter sp.]|nr:hypothetical protein [Caulobacter sp.]